MTKRIELIYEDKLDGKIPEELWFRKHEEYKREQERINDWLLQHQKGNYDYVESGVELLNLAQNAYRLYSRRSELEKRRLLTVVLSNCVLKAGKVSYNYKKPFDMIAKMPQNEKESG